MISFKIPLESRRHEGPYKADLVTNLWLEKAKPESTWVIKVEFGNQEDKERTVAFVKLQDVKHLILQYKWYILFHVIQVSPINSYKGIEKERQDGRTMMATTFFFNSFHRRSQKRACSLDSKSIMQNSLKPIFA